MGENGDLDKKYLELLESAQSEDNGQEDYSEISDIGLRNDVEDALGIGKVIEDDGRYFSDVDPLKAKMAYVNIKISHVVNHGDRAELERLLERLTTRNLENLSTRKLN